jgi:uncharacterized membrane protein YfcA
MDYSEILILFIIGVVSGIINTIAGGGSLLTLPIMIFMGLPPNIANGTNRIQLIMQNISAVSGFKSKGISDFKFSSLLSLTAILGSIVGAQIAIDISEELFKKILSIIMILVIATIIFKKNKPSELLNNYASKNKFISIFLFFFVGIYGGFIHAGVGFIILTILSNINNMKLSNANSIKVFVALAFSIISLLVFIYEDKVNWIYGINIGIGSALGGWIASRWSYNKSDRIIKIFLGITVGIMSIRLWFF